MAITSSYWQHSEKLLNSVLPTIILISCFLGFLLFGLLSSHISKKIILGSLAGLVLVNVLAFFMIFQQTEKYRALSTHESLKNRSVRTKTFGYDDLSHISSEAYVLTDVEEAEKLPFYSLEEDTLKADFSYLGKDEHLYFFEKNNVIYNLDVTNDLVKFSPDVKEVIYVRQSAILTDKTFKENYFKEKVGPVIIEIIIPSELEEEAFRPKIPTQKLVNS